MDIADVGESESPLPLAERKGSAPRDLNRARLHPPDLDRLGGVVRPARVRDRDRLFQIPDDRRPGGVLREDSPAAEVEAGNHVAVQVGQLAQQGHRVRPGVR